MNAVTEKVIGVIGGMGPEAAVDFLSRIISGVNARGDEDHIHVILDNNTKIPSRIAHLLDGNGDDPTPVLSKMARDLETHGADLLAIPCNTAHFYLPAISSSVDIPILDMIALTIEALVALGPSVRRVGILASTVVNKLGLYKSKLEAREFEVLIPDIIQQAKLFEIIYRIKSEGAQKDIIKEYNSMCKDFLNMRPDAFMIACTELSLLPMPDMYGIPCVDALEELVRASIREAKGAL